MEEKKSHIFTRKFSNSSHELEGTIRIDLDVLFDFVLFPFSLDFVIEAIISK